MMISERRSPVMVPDLLETRVTDRKSLSPLRAASAGLPSGLDERAGEEPENSPEIQGNTNFWSAGDTLHNTTSPEEGQTDDDRLSREADQLDQNSEVCALVQKLLIRSGYPLARVDCQCFDQSLELSGAVNQYYHLQVALEIAKQSAGGRQVDIRVQVQPDSSKKRA